MHQERGISLLELLIACTVLAVALLGLGLLATRAIQDAGSLRDHAMAQLLLADLMARAELVGHGPIESRSVDQTRASREFQGWQRQAASLLPSAQAELCRDGSAPDAHTLPRPCDGSGPLVVRLSWRRHGDVEWRQEPVSP